MSQLILFLTTIVSLQTNTNSMEDYFRELDFLNSLSQEVRSEYLAAVGTGSPFAMVWEQCGYHGPAKVFRGSIKHLGHWNDRVGSIRLYGGAGVNLFRDAQMAGVSLFISSDTSCLSSYDFMDSVSSIELVNKNSDKFFVMYEQCGFQGMSLAIRNSNSDIAGHWLDTLSSVKVFNGAQIRLFEHRNYEGKSITLGDHSQCLVDVGFNDMATSAVVY